MLRDEAENLGLGDKAEEASVLLEQRHAVHALRGEIIEDLLEGGLLTQGPTIIRLAEIYRKVEILSKLTVVESL